MRTTLSGDGERELNGAAAFVFTCAGTADQIFTLVPATSTQFPGAYQLRNVNSGKCVSVGLDRSYMYSGEYDMYEFNLGGTFHYSDMAALICPRPFMVERGHDDGVGTDEMVSYEYAKVRYLYANRLKLADRTEIEYFPGGHMNNCKGTFAFLAKHLKKEN